ncbi:hypothetical protein E3N88_32114 [Mikania micrantha]|uniref:Uncharacterized protein n=1 Tax=Mikania micrantha TaxID=192012 RepID=A0A5N6M7I1_9ASTR|nr:hypothetical protein E3N88_32114 [Mikania micrantha]
MDPSRYARNPWRKASRYEKQTGSWDSRIPSRYAKMIFDRPLRAWSLEEEQRNGHQPLNLHHQPLSSLDFAF